MTFLLDGTFEPVGVAVRPTADGVSVEVTGTAHVDAAVRQVARIFSLDHDGTGFEQLGDVPFDSWTDMLRVAPDLVRLGAYRTVYQMACRHVQDPRLRMVLTFQSLLVGGNPFATTSVYCLIAFLERRFGVHFAMGGTGSLVKGLVSLIEGQGGSDK